MATDAKAVKGFDVRCPFCGDEDARVRIDLNDLAGAEGCSCSNCDSEFGVKEAVVRLRDQLRQWLAVARWIEMAADLPDEGKD